MPSSYTGYDLVVSDDTKISGWDFFLDPNPQQFQRIGIHGTSTYKLELEILPAGTHVFDTSKRLYGGSTSALQTGYSFEEALRYRRENYNKKGGGFDRSLIDPC